MHERVSVRFKLLAILCLVHSIMRIRLENVSKKFGGVIALDRLFWNVEPGQIVAVLGPNGAGKTTLLNAIAGVILLDGGKVFLDGHPSTPDRGDLRRRFAFIPDIPPVPGGWSPLRFIATTLKLYEAAGEGLEDRVIHFLEQLDLLSVARWKFRQLSRGQVYKAVLAAFLAADPELWLLDEPFASGMDPRGLNCLKDYAREAIGRGRTFVFTTQIVEVAEQFAHRVCVLDRGQIRMWEECSSLRQNATLNNLLSQLREADKP